MSAVGRNVRRVSFYTFREVHTVNATSVGAFVSEDSNGLKIIVKNTARTAVRFGDNIFGVGFFYGIIKVNQIADCHELNSLPCRSIYPGMFGVMMLYDRVFAHGGINLILKFVHEFSSHILAVDKPTRVINIEQ